MNGICPNLDRLAAWIEGSLSDKERPALAAHLAQCDDCRRTVELAAIAMETKAEPLVPGAEERWLRAIRRPKARWWSWAAAAGVFLAISILAIAKLAKSEPPQPQPQPTPTADQPKKKEEEAPKIVPKHEKKVEEPNVGIRDIVTHKPPGGEKPEEAVAEEPKKEEPKKEDPAVKRDTKVDMSGRYEPLAIADGSGDLWMKKSEGEEFAKIDGTTRAGYGQLIESRKTHASFTIEGSATVAIEPETKVWIARSKEEKNYVLSIDAGVAFLDTEGMRQAWQFFCGAASVLMPQVQGRIFVQALQEQLEIHVLQGKVEIAGGTVDSGRSIRVDRTGKAQTAKAESGFVKKSLERLYKIRPAMRTVFAANFDETDPKTHPYQIILGSTRRDDSPKVLQYVRAEGATGAMVAKSGGGTAEAGIGIKFGREVTYLNGMVIRFKYRTNASILEVRAGKYSGKVSVKPSDGKWLTAEIPIEILEEEGVPIVSGDSIQEIFFNLPKDANRVGSLDVDGVELTRSARYAK